MTEQDLSERIFRGLTDSYFNRFESGLPAASAYHSEQETPKGAIRHCLLVAARSKILARDIGLLDDTIDDLVLGVALHDTFPNVNGVKPCKKTHEFLWEDFLRSYDQTRGRLKNAGFSEQVVALAGAASHLAYWQAEKILKNKPNEYGAAFLIVHYVDAYTADDEQISWVKPEEVREQKNEDDVIRNELDYRMVRKEFDYFNLSRGGVKHYKDKLGVGTRTFQAELRLCRDIEKYLCALINARRASPINPIIIPRCVDMKLRAEIVNGCRLS